MYKQSPSSLRETFAVRIPAVRFRMRLARIDTASLAMHAAASTRPTPSENNAGRSLCNHNASLLAWHWLTQDVLEDPRMAPHEAHYDRLIHSLNKAIGITHRGLA